jgi:hypothetical protein
MVNAGGLGSLVGGFGQLGSIAGNRSTPDIHIAQPIGRPVGPPPNFGGPISGPTQLGGRPQFYKKGGHVKHSDNERMEKTGDNESMEKAKGGSAKWIQGAIKKPGALHKSLGVPAGKKIPAANLEKASHASGKLGQRARMAMTLKGMK